MRSRNPAQVNLWSGKLSEMRRNRLPFGLIRALFSRCQHGALLWGTLMILVPHCFNRSNAIGNSAFLLTLFSPRKIIEKLDLTHGVAC